MHLTITTRTLKLRVRFFKKRLFSRFIHFETAIPTSNLLHSDKIFNFNPGYSIFLANTINVVVLLRNYRFGKQETRFGDAIILELLLLLTKEKLV